MLSELGKVGSVLRLFIEQSSDSKLLGNAGMVVNVLFTTDIFIAFTKYCMPVKSLIFSESQLIYNSFTTLVLDISKLSPMIAPG